MATQGIVSVLRFGHMYLKVVAGCDGMKAKDVAECFANKEPTNGGDAYARALDLGMGCEDCLVVQEFAPDGSVSNFPYSDSERYRDSDVFRDPYSNPRSASCGAAYTYVVQQNKVLGGHQ